MYTVKLTYFKVTGKYNTDGEYRSGCEQLYQIWDEVQQFVRERKLPGLVDGAVPDYILIRVPDHPHDHPRLILTKEQV